MMIKAFKVSRRERGQKAHLLVAEVENRKGYARIRSMHLKFAQPIERCCLEERVEGTISFI